jgi:acetylornithine deacetylase/succinyl-diaminopimelate desuccinylase family protein
MAEDGLIKLLRSLVRIPSVNPLLADDPSIGTEKPMAEALAALLADRGFRIEWHEVIAGRPNVIGRFGPNTPKRSLLIESHIDTQGVQGMTVPPFEGLVRDGRLFGRGACDTKGPMAAALWALSPAMLDRVASAGVQIVYVGAIGEEKGNVGAEQLVDLGLGADEALVLEPTELAIVHAHKGTLWYEVDVRGRAAHGSNPEAGVSAIRGMLRAIEEIEREIAAARNCHDDSALGGPSVNVGVIRGGSSINMVPDHCVIEVDRRTVPGEDSARILRDLRERLTRLQESGAIIEWRLTPINDGAPFHTGADTSLIRRLATSCASKGVAPRIMGAAWYSDAGPLSRTCKDIAVFGPGSIRQAHTADEYIDIAELQRGCDILRDFLRRVADEAESYA